MRRLTVLLLALALAGALPRGAAHAASFLDRPYGTPEAGLSVRERAMGGAGMVLGNGAYSLAGNPAALALARGSRVQMTAGLSRLSENRFVPLFDTFDSYVDEAAIAVNDHQYPSMNGGVTWDPGRWRGLVLAAGVLERLDPRYDYYDERRTTATTDQIVSERYIRTRGVLRTVSLGGAMPAFGGTTFGVAVHRYQGTIEDRDALVARASGVTGVVTARARRLSGTSVSVGGTWSEKRFALGLAYETAPRLHDDYTIWQNDSIVSAPQSSATLRLPQRWMVGGTYRPRNTLRTTFAVDAVYTPWSKMIDPLYADERCLSTWDVRFGLEHVYYNTLPGRIGFRYTRSYETREADRAAFTFGIGYRLDRIGFDLAGEVGKRESRQEPLWPRDEQGPAVGAGRDRVEDTTVRLFLGAEIGF
jgi:hypothetical protein